MSQETAELYAEAMRHLAVKARGVARDLNPKGEMKYMRIRAKRHEVLVALGEHRTRQPAIRERNKYAQESKKQVNLCSGRALFREKMCTWECF